MKREEREERQRQHIIAEESRTKIKLEEQIERGGKYLDIAHR